MRIHLDTNLLISEPRWELLPPGDHEFLVSALVFAEFSAAQRIPTPTSPLGLASTSSSTGQRMATACRSVSVKPTFTANFASSSPPLDGLREVRRVDLMIAAVAIGDGAVLATRNTADFDGLQPLLHVITL